MMCMNDRPAFYLLSFSLHALRRDRESSEQVPGGVGDALHLV